MNKNKKKEDFNLNKFLDSNEYQIKRQELQNDLNMNNCMFNIELPGIRLMKYTNLRPNYILTFKHTFDDKKRLKEAKINYNLQKNTPYGDERRSEFISAILNAREPNWNVSFKVLD